MKNVKIFLWISLGTLLLTAGVYFFKIPNGFSTGGVSGVGTLLGKLTPLSPALWISVINLLCLLIGFAVLGKATGIKTVYCSLLFSGLTQVFEWTVPLKKPLTNQPFLELVYAMLLTSVGSAIIFRYGASSGGTDIIAMILKKYTTLEIGTAIFAADLFIAASAFFAFDFQTGLFSILGLFAKTLVIDSAIENFNLCKYFTVITVNPKPICDFIHHELDRSATIYKAEGAYSHTERSVILTVMKRSQAVRLRRFVRDIDPHAFIMITNSSEIIGKGFLSN